MKKLLGMLCLLGSVAAFSYGPDQECDSTSPGKCINGKAINCICHINKLGENKCHWKDSGVCAEKKTGK